MPTPPPWCRLTQVAPEAQFRSALSSGQSETASEPSRIASVSRLGEATEPESRWSRPITTGALSSPRAPISLKAGPTQRGGLGSPAPPLLVEGEPQPVPVAQAYPADASRQSLEADPLLRHV